jgi:predicted DNA-binding protein
MSEVGDLLEAMASAAQRNEKSEFDGLERELFARYSGGFQGMPEEIYQRYLEVDRHWPIAVEPAEGGSPRRRTVQIRLPALEEAWLQERAIETDRSLSAVIAECIEAVRNDPDLAAEVRERLRRGRSLDEEE